MAYPPQQGRFANGDNYHNNRSGSAPPPQQGSNNDVYGGGYQQHDGYDYDNGYMQEYSQPASRRPPPRQQGPGGHPRQPQGYPPKGRSQQRMPPPRNAPGAGQMREPRGGAPRGNYGERQYANGGGYPQQQPRGYGPGVSQQHNNGYGQDYGYQDQYQDQYNGYAEGQYDDSYDYHHQDAYQQPQQYQQSRPNGSQSRSPPQQGYNHSSYDQRPPIGQGRSQKPPSINGNPQRRPQERILQSQPESPNLNGSWDNPFPSFPVQDKPKSEPRRPSTASGQHRNDQHGYAQEQNVQPTHDNYSDSNVAYNNQGGHQNIRTMSPPQPGFAQPPQRSNTMPTDLSQNMANMTIQPQNPSNVQSRSIPQHLNFSQPRRPSASNQSSNNSNLPTQGGVSHGQADDTGAGYDDLLDSYAEEPEPERVMSRPFASPGPEEMPDFGAAGGNGIDKTLHMATQGQNGAQSNGVPSRKISQGNNQFPPRDISSQHQYNKSSPQQYGNDQWQQGQPEFVAPVRSQTDSFGPGQVPARKPSDPYNSSQNRQASPPDGPLPARPGANGGRPDMRSGTSMDGQRISSEPTNRAGSNIVSPSMGVGAMSSDSLPGHPVPVRPGLNQNGHSPMNSNGQASRPPPVRNYNGGPTPGSGQALPVMQYAQQRQPTQQQYQQGAPLPPSQAPANEGPVTHEELQRLRGQLQQNPSDQALELRLAKRLVEAASTLADDGGRADPKTRNRNRERYMMEANRIVKKQVAYNYTDAMFFMAECYGDGTLGLPKDPSQAFTLYQSAAKLNHAPSAYRVAVCCELGADEGGGTKRDPLKAVQWYQRAATLGDVPAMYKIGVIKLKGLLGQPPNHQEAIAWLRRAAEHADADNPHALHELGLLYQNGGPEGNIPRDDNFAIQMFQQAADLGYKFSQFSLGQAFEFGFMGFPIDARQSITWYSKAAQQDEHKSELALSGWYLTGAEGIMAQNDTEAYLWARKAANAGLAKAEYAMGYFTEVGIGCPAELEGAKRWYWKAASQNYPQARERLEALRRGGPKMQKARVSRSAVNRDQGDCKVM